MKKIIISIATISVFIFTSCFTDSDTATVKINLGNLPVAKTAKVEKKSIIDRFVALFLKEAIAQDIPLVPEGTSVSMVHLGAFDANKHLLANKSIKVTEVGGDPVNTVVEFDVPAGVRRKIVVLGAQESGETQDDNGNIIPIYTATYYGVSDEIALNAGENREVSIDMKGIVDMDGNVTDGFNSYLNLYDAQIHGTSGEPSTWAHITGASHYNIYKDWNKEFVESITTNEYWASYNLDTNDLNLGIYFDFAKIESSNIFFKVC